jgi:hypothetical protein
MEWWKSKSFTADGRHNSYYEITGGINYKPHANFIVRPEIRYNWTPSDVDFAQNANPAGIDFNNTVFGIDAILTY